MGLSARRPDDSGAGNREMRELPPAKGRERYAHIVQFINAITRRPRLAPARRTSRNEHLLSQFSHTIGIQMMKLLEHHVNAAEATRLGVISGWYGTKVSGTFVTGPFPTEEGCLESITAVGPISQDQPR